MSPDMMVSSDSPYTEGTMEDKKVKSTFSNDDETNFTEHDSGNTKSNNVGMKNLPESDLCDDKSNLKNSNGSDPYNAETQPYSQSEPTNDSKNEEASYSMSYYLPQSTDKNSSSAPLFVTASSMGDSEKANTTHSDPLPVAIIPEIREDHLVNMSEGDDGTSQIDGQNDLHCDEATGKCNMQILSLTLFDECFSQIQNFSTSCIRDVLHYNTLR